MWCGVVWLHNRVEVGCGGGSDGVGGAECTSPITVIHPVVTLLKVTSHMGDQQIRSRRRGKKGSQDAGIGGVRWRWERTSRRFQTRPDWSVRNES